MVTVYFPLAEMRQSLYPIIFAGAGERIGP